MAVGKGTIIFLCFIVFIGDIKGSSVTITTGPNETIDASDFFDSSLPETYSNNDVIVDGNTTYFNSTNSTYLTEERIINGQIVMIEKFPYQVSLEHKNSFTCGGSIISQKWVLTAGHCISGRFAKNFKIRAGSSFRGMGGVVHDVNRIVRHPLYLIYFFYDFALMEVKSPFSFTSDIQAIKIASKLPRHGTKVTVSGFGKTKALPWNKPSEVLKATELKMYNHFLCNFIYYGIVDWTHFCAKRVLQGPCSGDSGGPLTVYQTNGATELIGVVSWAARGCSSYLGFPSVYGNVPRVRRWIKRVANV